MTTMRLKDRIERKIRDGLRPSHLEVINESGLHSVPPDAESHFRIVVVSDAFRDSPPIERHRRIYELLQDELRDAIHALTITARTADEWQRSADTPASPRCLGGSKREPESGSGPLPETTPRPRQ